jgi:hypothetical protein
MQSSAHTQINYPITIYIRMLYSKETNDKKKTMYLLSIHILHIHTSLVCFVLALLSWNSIKLKRNNYFVSNIQPMF